MNEDETRADGGDDDEDDDESPDSAPPDPEKFNWQPGDVTVDRLGVPKAPRRDASESGGPGS